MSRERELASPSPSAVVLPPAVAAALPALEAAVREHSNGHGAVFACLVAMAAAGCHAVQSLEGRLARPMSMRLDDSAERRAVLLGLRQHLESAVAALNAATAAEEASSAPAGVAPPTSVHRVFTGTVRHRFAAYGQSECVCCPGPHCFGATVDLDPGQADDLPTHMRDLHGVVDAVYAAYGLDGWSARVTVELSPPSAALPAPADGP